MAAQQILQYCCRDLSRAHQHPGILTPRPQDGILAYLLWGWWGSGLLQPTFPLDPVVGEVWDTVGGLAAGLAAGYIFEIFENSDYVINK